MEAKLQITVDRPADATWKIIGDNFGDIGDWAAGISSSSRETAPARGATRTCQSAGFGPIKAGHVRETLTSFDAEARSLAYRATEGLPRFIKQAGNRWSVHEIDTNHSLVMMHGTVEIGGWMRLLAPLLMLLLKPSAVRTLEELKHYVEYGRPHPRKEKELARAGLPSGVRE